ncbi:MAG: hypothetical protein GQ570_11860 [Helicobacteraceae bacterium]|nr:hypothetical protein [Helicobacteraceae bacterium]
MTREEAIVKNTELFNDRDVLNESDVDDLIIDIFEYFESRTCENCSFSILDQIVGDTVLYQCGKRESETYTMIYNKDFGCNKFEPK